MKGNKKFSKDPKVHLVSIEQFLEDYNYLVGLSKADLWIDSTIPRINSGYFKITPRYLIYISFGYTMTNYGLDEKEILEYIQVACRDGKTEYELFDKKINSLKEERAKHRKSKRLDAAIFGMQESLNLLPKYKETFTPIAKPFESYLIDTGYKTTKEKLIGKYLVFDVETNGIRTANDDLLSLSIYDPTTGICYNRFFPLELQPLVLTTFIHGITDSMLEGIPHMTQEEMDWLMEYFHLKDRILLSYSGGRGTFDACFVNNYCKRHKIVGFEDLQFQNIKNAISEAPMGTEGQLSKDNLCRLLKIEGVSDIHSSLNDCILQWKLFEELDGGDVFFIDNHVFRYHPDYIIPCSYLLKSSRLAKTANISLPHVKGKITEIFKYEFPKKTLQSIKKFQTNITGITIEHLINSKLGAQEQNNFRFLVQNKSHLEYLGSLESEIQDIPIVEEEDGSIKAIKTEDKKYIDEINNTTKMIAENIQPLLDFLRHNIFHGEIMSQELKISEDGKVLARCDLSDEKSVVEIKTTDVLEDETTLKETVTRQLFYQAQGRNAYVLSIQFESCFSGFLGDTNINGLSLHLYKVEFEEYVQKENLSNCSLREITILKALHDSPSISKNELADKIGTNSKVISYILKELERLGYIRKKKILKKYSPYLLLIDVED